MTPILPHTTLTAAIFLAATLPLSAQLGRRDLEDLERHRRSESRSTSTVHSFDFEGDTIKVQNGVYTWDFLDEKEAAEETPSEMTETARESIEATMSGLPPDLAIPYSEQMNEYMADYLFRHRKSMGRIIGKYRYYVPQWRAAFRKHGVPEEICALAIVESAFNIRAVSKAGATGVWQFMPETARRYGMTVDIYVDERLDPLRSGEAAARYLANAYKHFGDWRLAIASYNCGPQNVTAAILKAGSSTFWEIYPYLPAETRGYVPSFISALYALTYYEAFGIEPRPYGEGKVTQYKITTFLTFEQVTQACSCPKEDLERLNPKYIKGIIPGSKKKPYILRIPGKYEKNFDAYLKSHAG